MSVRSFASLVSVVFLALVSTATGAAARPAPLTEPSSGDVTPAGASSSGEWFDLAAQVGLLLAVVVASIAITLVLVTRHRHRQAGLLAA